MLAITIELLTGRYVATEYNDRDKAEWPPHPARLFSALVAAWADHEPTSADGELELQALHWLERQTAPEVLAAEAARRSVLTVFVPVNDAAVVSPPNSEKLRAAEAALAHADSSEARDKASREIERLSAKLMQDTVKAIAAPTKITSAGLDAAVQMLPDARKKQARTHPSATPEISLVGLVWPEAELPGDLRPGLERLLSRLTRLGHSTSLVVVRLASTEEVDTLSKRVTRLQPDEQAGDVILRWVNRGQVEALGRAHSQHREIEPRVLPARFVPYRQSRPLAEADVVATSEFSGDFLILGRVAGPRLPIVAGVGLSKQIRSALMSIAHQPPHEALSGHTSDREPSEAPHLAIVPLPFVSGPKPDGTLVGVALVIPRTVSEEGRRNILSALGSIEKPSSNNGDRRERTLEIALDASAPLLLGRDLWRPDQRTTLQRETWTQPARHWLTATPVALDRNPGDLHSSDPKKRAQAFDEANEIVASAVTRIGLPRPVEIEVVRSCVLPGTSKPSQYPRFPSAHTRPQRVLVHVRLTFEKKVAGPILIGAGRFHGLGLFLPLRESSNA